MKDAQSYYIYKPADGGEWYKKDAPRRDADFEKGLERIAGINTFGNPILRVRWAGTLLSDVAAKKTLKYKAIWEGFSHFVYKDGEGNPVKVLRESDAPKGAVIESAYVRHELGRLLWIVEQWQSVEDAVKTGRFNPKTLGEDGKPLFRPPPPEGVYNAFFWIQTLNGGYRELDSGILNAVAAMWKYQQTTSIDKQTADTVEDERREKRQASAANSELWRQGVTKEAAQEEAERRILTLEDIARENRRSIIL